MPGAAGLPPIAGRAGIELRPVDLHDPQARAWLQACAPPEASALARLAAAVEVARRHPAPIVAGDAVTALPGVLAGFPPGQPVVVVDAYLAVFLSGEQRAELMAIMAGAARTRPVTWLSLDPLVPLGPTGNRSVQGLDLPAALVRDYQEQGVFALLGSRTFPSRARPRAIAGPRPPLGPVGRVDRRDPAVTPATADPAARPRA